MAMLSNCDNCSGAGTPRSEEHTSELQSLTNLVCRLLLEKKKQKSIAALSPLSHHPQAILRHTPGQPRAPARCGPVERLFVRCPALSSLGSCFFFLNNPAPPEISPLPYPTLSQ